MSRSRFAALLCAMLFVCSVATLSTASVSRADPSPPSGANWLLDVHEGLPDFDTRTSRLSPSAQQLALADSLGATVRWNAFGTPQSMIKYGDYLATGLSGDAVSVARAFVRANRVLFRLSDQAVSDLEVLNDSRLVNSQSHVVLFRQHYGDLPAAQDGMITVGVTDDRIAYVSSSATGDMAAPPAATITAQQAWLAASANIGRPTLLTDILSVGSDNSWTTLTVTGFAQTQRARLVGFPIAGVGARPAYEVIVLDVKGGDAQAYSMFVDAQTAQVLFRQNKVYRASSTSAFQGTYQDDPLPKACGPLHPFNVPTGTKSIDVVASAAIISNDIVLHLKFGATDVATSDTATSPEAIHYEPVVLTPGVYNVQVCPYATPTAPPVPPYNYAGTFTTNDAASSQPAPYPPKWKVFPANPNLNYSNTDARQLWCWESSVNGVPVPGCQRALRNLAARAPWDYDTRANAPTNTTKGNNANAAEAWGSPLTPSEPYRPVTSTREYAFAWTNQWYTSNCSPTVFSSLQRNDIDAAIVNLFAMHNRMHDFAYYLGFTEQNYNSQDNNFGNTAPGPYPNGRENDPQVGDAQAGATSGGAPSYLGRDNANQITLNDGISPISNMYLWQPIAAAFYAPCVDGDYDMSVIGHEYTHAISNRMVGGPDANLTGQQAGSMGESWSDLNALEYLLAYGFVPTGGENPFSVGAYVTGNKQKGIRDYSLDANPLNYSNIGFDVTGPEVHADGEIWNAVNFELRQVLIDKYNSTYAASNTQLQRDCADGKYGAEQCPGNRRWIQIVYDAFLLMQPAVSMVDARDAYLAADMLRFGGANQQELWRAFAHRGLGRFAASNTTDDTHPKPNFESPAEPSATVTFRAVAVDENNAPIAAKVYVGQYEARSYPIADTSTPISRTAKFVPGTYEFFVQANGYGLSRFTETFAANENRDVTFSLATNWASKFKGATVTATSSPTQTLNAIDDSENTNWSGSGQMTSPQSLTIQFSSPRNITRLNVSTLLGPGQNRFTALRRFRIDVSSDGTTFTPAYTSPADAFPGAAPRPVAPDLILRTFTLPSPVAAKYVRLIALTNQCQGGPAFQGDQDSDPSNNSDCTTGNAAQADRVRVTEVEVFGSASTATELRSLYLPLIIRSGTQQ